jgi:hypothetical protein
MSMRLSDSQSWTTMYQSARTRPPSGAMQSLCVSNVVDQSLQLAQGRPLRVKREQGLDP